MLKNLNSLYYKIRFFSLKDLFDIPTHLTAAEKILLLTLGTRAALAKGNVTNLEIGSYLGASSCFLAAALAKANSNGIIYCIDTWKNDSMSEGNRDTMAEFLANTEKYSSWITPIRGISTEVVKQVEGKLDSIDLLFIDGDHSYQGCLADWLAYRPFLARKATIIMHDIGWAAGVKRVIEERIRPLIGMEGRLPNMWWGQLKK